MRVAFLVFVCFVLYFVLCVIFILFVLFYLFCFIWRPFSPKNKIPPAGPYSPRWQPPAYSAQRSRVRMPALHCGTSPARPSGARKGMEAGDGKEHMGPDPALYACPAPVGFFALSRWSLFQTLFSLVAPCLLPVLLGSAKPTPFPYFILVPGTPAVSNAQGLCLAQEGSDTWGLWLTNKG